MARINEARLKKGYSVKGSGVEKEGAVYASKAFNDLLPMYSITRSMSRAGTPTDNAAMESINGWIYSLKYLTPQQYKEAYAPKDFILGGSAGS